MSTEAKVKEAEKPPVLLDLLLKAPGGAPSGIGQWHRDHVASFKGGVSGDFQSDMQNNACAIAMQQGLMLHHTNGHPLGRDLTTSEIETLLAARAICEAKLNQRPTSTIYGKIYARVAGAI